MNIKDKIYDECMKLAQNNCEKIANKKEFNYSYYHNGQIKSAHYNIDCIRQWIDLQIAHNKGVVSNIEALDSILLGYVPEHLIARIKFTNGLTNG